MAILYDYLTLEPATAKANEKQIPCGNDKRKEQHGHPVRLPDAGAGNVKG